MAKTNPNIVLEAVNETEKTVGAIKIYPLTISRYARLEQLDSPFIGYTDKFEINSIIPSVYVMCNDKQLLKKYSNNDIEQLRQDAFDWADSNLVIEDVPEVIKYVAEQFTKISKAAPNGTSENVNSKKKA